MSLAISWTQYAILGVVSVNLTFLVIITLYVRDLYKKEESRQNVMESNMLTLAEEVFKKLEHVNRWLKVLAKMVNDDRIRLQEHDSKVEEMHDIARRLRDKFLKDT